jgi:hypothetical protein
MFPREGRSRQDLQPIGSQRPSAPPDSPERDEADIAAMARPKSTLASAAGITRPRPAGLPSNRPDVGDLAIIEFRGLLQILSRHAAERARNIFPLGEACLPRANARKLDKAVIMLRPHLPAKLTSKI